MGLIPSVNTPSSITGTGTLVRDAGLLSGHVFNAGLEVPDILKALIIKFPQYYLLSLTDKIGGGSGELESNTHAWNVQDRTRRSATLTYVSGTGSTPIVVDTDIADGSNDSGYYLVGDVVRVAETGVNFRVTAVTASGGFQRISLAKYDEDTTIASTEVNGFQIGHVATGFGEGSTSSGGFRTYLPTADYNVTSIL